MLGGWVKLTWTRRQLNQYYMNKVDRVKASLTNNTYGLDKGKG